MKHERLSSAAAGILLASVMALGTVGCLQSAFHLNLEYPAGPLWICGGFALLSGLLLSFRHGGTVLLCLLALICGYIYHDGRLVQQTLQLIYRLTTVYDRAYGWGVLRLTGEAWDAGFADWPLGVIGAAAALAVCLCVCRRKTVWLPALAVLLPLSACIVVTDTVPDEIWLAPVLAGLVLLLMTASVRRDDPAQGVRLTAMMTLPVTAALLAAFLLIPQEGYVNRSEAFRQNILTAARNLPTIAETGISSSLSGLRSQPPKQVDLASLGARIPFTYPVMEVTAQTGGTLYLREQDYDRYDGQGWQSAENRREGFFRTDSPAYTVTVRTLNRKDIRYLPYYPAEETLLLGGRVENGSGETKYTITYCLLPSDWRQTAYENPAVSGEWEVYLALPDTTRQDARDFLGDDFFTGTSNTEKADRIAALVTNSAVYDLDPGRMPEGEPDFALWFLREAEAGYCVHFATAATVLLRAAEVPARYVTGYLVDAAAGEPVTVTEENAHAWAEYYEPNLDAWIPLEATPEAETPENRPMETEGTRPRETIPETVPETRPELTAPPEIPAETLPAAEPAEAEASWLWLLGVPLAAGLVSLQRSVRLALRRRRRQQGEANARALYRWQEAVRLSRLLKESPTEELMVLAQKAKFSQHTITEEELQVFDSYCRSCLRKLKQRSFFRQLVYRYVYAIY